MLNSTSSNLPRSCLRATSSARISCDPIDLACTCWNHPIRSSWASGPSSPSSPTMPPSHAASPAERFEILLASAPHAAIVITARLKPNPIHRNAKFLEETTKNFRLARDLRLLQDLASPIHNANAREFQRDVDSGIVLHGCPPSQMPGADSTS